MKKLFLSVMLVAFAVAVQAGEGKACGGDKAACCAKKASVEAKGQCPAAAAKQAQAKSANGCCAAGKQAVAAKVASPKGSEQAKR
jgi:hypothetical protein